MPQGRLSNRRTERRCVGGYAQHVSGSGVQGSAVQRLFAEPGLDWQPVSEKLVVERRLPLVVVAALGLLLVAAGRWLAQESATAGWVITGLGGLGVGAAAAGWFLVVPRVVRAWRYAEREQDLLVSRGRVLRRLTVVPYGRMQVIEVSANPVSAKLGIATVTLVTASASTDARIPGVPVGVAHELRDRLAAKGEASTAGL